MLKQSLSLKQLQKLSPQQIQLIRLLQMPMLALEQKVKQELEENPALEEAVTEADLNDDPEVVVEDSDTSRDTSDFDINDYLDEDDVESYKLRSNNYTDSTDYRESPISMGESFHEFLWSQFQFLGLSEKETIIGEFIIGNIDNSGYLQRQPQAIVDDLAFSQNIFTDENEVKQVLSLIQGLDPAGVGASDLKECLLLQLERAEDTESVRLARKILTKLFDAFVNKRYDHICQRLNISEKELKEAIDEIIQLNPKPGSLYSDSIKQDNQTIIPDFIVKQVGGKMEVSLNSRNSPHLMISQQYADMLHTYAESRMKSKEQKDAVLFIKQKIDSAKAFIESIKMRHDTLLSTMEAIVELQFDFFKEGDISVLKPMKMKDVAEKIGLDISTVSRVVNSKYVETSFGIFSLKEFFSTAITTDDGDETTAAKIKDLIAELISQEDKKHPLNDEALTSLLAEKGYTLARRTVAKYREGLGIGVARLRKEITS